MRGRADPPKAPRPCGWGSSSPPPDWDQSGSACPCKCHRRGPGPGTCPACLRVLSSVYSLCQKTSPSKMLSKLPPLWLKETKSTGVSREGLKASKRVPWWSFLRTYRGLFL